MLESLEYALDALPTLLRGSLTTLQLTAVSVAFGLVGGILLGIARLSPLLPLRIATRAYIDFFRGTPLLVQIYNDLFRYPGFSEQLRRQL